LLFKKKPVDQVVLLLLRVAAAGIAALR